VIFVDYILLRH